MLDIDLATVDVKAAFPISQDFTQHLSQLSDLSSEASPSFCLLQWSLVPFYILAALLTYN